MKKLLFVFIVMLIPYFSHGSEAGEYVEIKNERYKTIAIATMFKEYFGKPDLQYTHAMEYENIVVLIFEDSFFIVSKKKWMSPIISITENGSPNKELFLSINDTIQKKIDLGDFPSLDEQEKNSRKWQYLFSKWNYLFNTNDNMLARSNTNTTDILEETGFNSLKLYNINQSKVKNSSIKVNYYTPKVDGKNTPVGCGPLAIARIMNWHEHPKTNVFGYGSTYKSLDASKMTYSFAKLVRDVGRYGNATYDTDGTSLNNSETIKIFQAAGYNIKKLAELTDTRYDASQLYINIKNEIDSGRLAYLNIWYDHVEDDGTTGRGGHSVVIDGYKKIDPAGFALEDLYMHAAFGQRYTTGGFYDSNWVQLDAYGGWLDSVIGSAVPGLGSVSPKGKKNVTYALYGNITKKSTISSGLPYFDGTGSLIDPERGTACSGCGEDLVKLHSHGQQTSAGFFQVFKIPNACESVDLKGLGSATVEVRSWSGRGTNSKYYNATNSSHIIPLNESNDWSLIAFKTNAPIPSGSTRTVTATCLSNNSSNVSETSGTPMKFDNNYFWGGNGSLINHTNNQYSADTQAGYGKNRDTAVLLKDHKTLSVFQITNGEGCRKVRFTTPVSFNLSWKLWNEKNWRGSKAFRNNDVFTFPTNDYWWILKIKAPSVNENKARIDAVCER